MKLTLIFVKSPILSNKTFYRHFQRNFKTFAFYNFFVICTTIVRKVYLYLFSTARKKWIQQTFNKNINLLSPSAISTFIVFWTLTLEYSELDAKQENSLDLISFVSFLHPRSLKLKLVEFICSDLYIEQLDFLISKF